MHQEYANVRRALFDDVVRNANAEGLLSDQFFNVDRTPFAATFLSFRAKAGLPP